MTKQLSNDDADDRFADLVLDFMTELDAVPCSKEAYKNGIRHAISELKIALTAAGGDD